MRYVKPRKSFGQHYLTDEHTLLDIVDLFRREHQSPYVLEIGPGMGALTQFFWKDYADSMTLVELDRRCADWLEEHFEGIGEKLVRADFLRLDLDELLNGPTSVIGNFPYNISSQIVFKILEAHRSVPLVVGMFQKEVAMRLASGPGSRVYGVISALVQLHYDIEVVFDIAPEKFDPPPKVVSSVLVMKAHGRPSPVDENAYRKVVKSAFSMRRKKLKNALAGILDGRELPDEYVDKRAEALSVYDFTELTKWWLNHGG